jgi:hypothetical protein
MSYHKYDLPKQPKTPLDDAIVLFGTIGLVSVVLLVGMLLWCAG